jgi:hypothetical protein
MAELIPDNPQDRCTVQSRHLVCRFGQAAGKQKEPSLYSRFLFLRRKIRETQGGTFRELNRA